MRVYPLEAFDQVGDLRRDGAELPPIGSWFGNQGFETTFAVAEHPVEQTIDRNRRPFGIGEIVVTGGNLPSAPREFPRRKAEFQNQRRNEAVTKQGDFLRFASTWKVCRQGLC
jgi:hypothetical protein